MKRWELSLFKQVEIVTRHTTELVNRLIYLNNRKMRLTSSYIETSRKKGQKKEEDLKRVIEKMKHIVSVLEIVEPMFFKSWPKSVQEVYTTVKREKDEKKLYASQQETH